MKILIAYRSRYGTTAECAGKVAKHLQGDVDVIDLKNNKNIDLKPYDTVLIGGSIYAGQIQNSLVRFCEKQKKQLLNKKLGLFICCLYEDEKAAQELEENFPEWLKARSTAREWFGGRATLSRMRAIDRFLFTRIARVDSDVSKIREDRIERFCKILEESPGA